MCWVDRCFELEDEIQEQIADKRRKLLTGVGVVPVEIQQQRAFIAMTATGEDSEGKYKERTVYRVAARRWVANLDNQISRSTAWVGLAHFMPKEHQGFWEPQNWRCWPALGIARDNGSDGNTGVHALLYKYGLNIWDWQDNSHISGRAFQEALQDMGLWEMWLLLLISWHLPYGPNDDEYRRHQLDQSMTHFFAVNTDQSPLWQEHCQEIVQDLEEGGIILFARDKPVEEEAFEYAKSVSILSKNGRRTSNCRFGGPLAAAIYNLPLWGLHLFQRQYCALKLGHLQSPKTLQKLTVRFRNLQEGDEVTNPRKINIESRALRSCASNALVVSVMVLMEKDHKRIVQMIVQIAENMKSWHTRQNVELRDVYRTKTWLIQQLDGDLMLYFYSYVAVLEDVNALRKCQFTVPMASDKLDIDSLSMLIEDDFSDYMGGFAVALAKACQKRLAYLFNFPHYFIASLVKDPNKKSLIREEFKRYVEVYNKLIATEGKGQTHKIIESRHPLGTTPGKRCIHAFADGKPDSMDDFEELIAEMAQGCPQTQIVEDIIGSQKNSKTTRNYSKVKRPEISMSMVLEQRIIDNRHRYQPIDMSLPTVGSSPKIPSSAFNQSRSSWSFDWKDIASTKQSPDFYSPAAQYNAAHYTDRDLVDAAAKSADGFLALERSFFGCLFECSHRTAFCFVLVCVFVCCRSESARGGVSGSVTMCACHMFVFVY